MRVKSVGLAFGRVPEYTQRAYGSVAPILLACEAHPDAAKNSARKPIAIEALPGSGTCPRRRQGRRHTARTHGMATLGESLSRVVGRDFADALDMAIGN